MSDLIRSIAERARAADCFDGVTMPHDRAVHCVARGASDHAEYRVELDADMISVSLVTNARYLSQSIEQILVIHGDKIGDLIREELIDLGAPLDTPSPVVDHFRSPPPEKLYTFRTCLPRAANAEQVAMMLLAFEHAFVQLGGMAGNDDE